MALAAVRSMFNKAPLFSLLLTLLLATSGCSSLLSGDGTTTDGSPSSGSGSGGGGGSGGVVGTPGGLDPSSNFIDDQDFVIPENAVVGDTVGRAKPYPTVTLTSAIFSITAGNSSGIFEIDSSTGMISIAGSASLDGTYDLTVSVQTNGSLTDNAIVTVTVLDEAETIFIDPEANDSAENGSRAHPFNSFDDFGFGDYPEGFAFLAKRDTTIARTEPIFVGRNHMLLGAYGAGERPLFHIDKFEAHAIYNWNGPTGITIRDIEVFAPGGTSCLRFGGDGPGTTIDNVVCHGPVWGFRAFTPDIRFVYSEIYDIVDDGMFIQHVDGAEIAYNYVHHVNTAWVPPYTPQGTASGDAIQFNNVANWHVHHNRTDRTNSGNKFCFIATGDSQNSGVFEYNLLQGPLTDGDGGASIYFANGDGLVVRYNTIEGPSPGAMWSHTPNTEFYGNIVYGMGSGPQCYVGGANCRIDNNVFHDLDKAIYVSGSLTARNNIFSLVDADDVAIASSAGNFTDVDFNLYTRGPTDGGTNSFIDDPLFVDIDNFNFNLQEGSPAIDAGIDIGLPRVGDYPDIGAIERQVD